MKQQRFFGMFLMIILFIGVFFQPSYAQTYTTEGMSSGIYPDAVIQPLLSDVYNVSKNPGYDDKSSSDIYTNYPQFPAKNYSSNNIKYWRLPTNGRCMPSGMCSGLYDNTEPAVPIPPIAPVGNPRVNYFVSTD